MSTPVHKHAAQVVGFSFIINYKCIADIITIVSLKYLSNFTIFQVKYNPQFEL
jgi:hypothetical protein